MIFDVTKQVCLAHAAIEANSWWSRLRGMIARHFTPELDAMIFNSCAAVHTCFMTEKIDVLFLDAAHVVTAVFREVSPWRLCCFGGKNAVKAVELPSGTLTAADVRAGDVIRFSAEISAI